MYSFCALNDKRMHRWFSLTKLGKALIIASIYILDATSAAWSQDTATLTRLPDTKSSGAADADTHRGGSRRTEFDFNCPALKTPIHLVGTETNEVEEIRAAIQSHCPDLVILTHDPQSPAPAQVPSPEDCQSLTILARSLGYVVARFDCKTSIKFIPGRLDSISLDPRMADLTDDIVQVIGTMKSTYKDNIIHLNDLETLLLNIQDLPGITVQSVIERKPGADGLFNLKLVIRYKPVSTFVALDNSGPAYAGPIQMTAGVAWNLPNAWMRQVDVTGLTTPGREQRFGQGGITIGLGRRGKRLRIQAGYGEARPSGDLGVTGFRSQVASGRGELQIPLLRRRSANLNARVGSEILNSSIDAAGIGTALQRVSESRLRIVSASLDHDTLDSNGFFQGRLSVDKGLRIAGASSDAELRDARPDSTADFTRLTGFIQRRQGIWAGELSSLQLNLSARGQYAFDILPPNQKILLGGEQGGRGYELGQLSGDHGAIGNAEIAFRYSTVLADKPGYITTYAFYDYATVWEIAPFDEGRRQLQSVGVGMRAEIDGRHLLNVYVARRLTLNPTRSNEDPLPRLRAVASLILRF